MKTHPTNTLAVKILLLMLLLISSAAGAMKDKGNPEADKKYEQLVAQLKSGDTKINYKELRLSFAASKYYDESDSADIKKLRGYVNDKKFEDALKLADQLIEKSIVDMEAHLYAFIVEQELKHTEKAVYQKAILTGLLLSIQENHEGLSPEDAFTVINVHEEYVYLMLNFMQVKQQSLQAKGAHQFDVMKCKPQDSDKTFDLYFNIDIPMKRLNDALAH